MIVWTCLCSVINAFVHRQVICQHHVKICFRHLWDFFHCIWSTLVMIYRWSIVSIIIGHAKPHFGQHMFCCCSLAVFKKKKKLFRHIKDIFSFTMCSSEAHWYQHNMFLLVHGSGHCFLFQILWCWSQRYENSSRMNLGEWCVFIYVCWCACVCVCVAVGHLHLWI